MGAWQPRADGSSSVTDALGRVLANPAEPFPAWSVFLCVEWLPHCSWRDHGGAGRAAQVAQERGMDRRIGGGGGLGGGRGGALRGGGWAALGGALVALLLASGSGRPAGEWTGAIARPG